MSFVTTNKGGYLTKDGKTFYVVGINYIPNYVCTNFWENWRPEVIEKDFARIRNIGLNSIRFPMFWEFNEPEPGKYNPVIFDEFNQMLEMARRYNIYLMPFFLVGVATGTYDVSYRKGRSIYGKEMLELEKAHLQTFIRRYKDEPMILAWDICDEPYGMMEIFEGKEKAYPSPEVASNWVSSLYKAIKKVDQNQIVRGC